MKSKRRIFFCAAAVAILIAIAALMMVIGRGHTVYFDNRTLEYNGQTYESPYKVTVFVKGEQAAKLYDKERGMSVWIGQRFSMDLEIMDEKGGDERAVHIDLALPYNMDGIIVNLPAVLAGLPQDAWLSEFIPTPTKEEAEEELPGGEDDLGLGDEFGGAEDLGI